MFAIEDYIEYLNKDDKNKITLNDFFRNDEMKKEFYKWFKDTKPFEVFDYGHYVSITLDKVYFYDGFKNDGEDWERVIRDFLDSCEYYLDDDFRFDSNESMFRIYTSNIDFARELAYILSKSYHNGMLKEFFDFEKMNINRIIDESKYITNTKKCNEIIRTLIDKSYFMNPVERLTYRLLSHYAFVLHDNPSDITDIEINEARQFALKYVERHNNKLPQILDKESKEFVNKVILKTTTDINFDELVIKLLDKLKNDDYFIEFNFYNDSNYDRIVIEKYINDDIVPNFYIYDIGSKRLSFHEGMLDTKYLDNLGTYHIDNEKKINENIKI